MQYINLRSKKQTVRICSAGRISEFSKERPDKNVIAFYEARKNLCAISSVTLQELEFGITRMADGKKKDYLRKCIDQYKSFLEVIPYDDFSATICGQAIAQFSKEGKSLPVCDTQIAATAISNGMVLVTHNTADFKDLAEHSFLRVEDWIGK